MESRVPKRSNSLPVSFAALEAPPLTPIPNRNKALESPPHTPNPNRTTNSIPRSPKCTLTQNGDYIPKSIRVNSIRVCGSSPNQRGLDEAFKSNEKRAISFTNATKRKGPNLCTDDNLNNFEEIDWGNKPKGGAGNDSVNSFGNEDGVGSSQGTSSMTNSICDDNCSPRKHEAIEEDKTIPVWDESENGGYDAHSQSWLHYAKRIICPNYGAGQFSEGDSLVTAESVGKSSVLRRCCSDKKAIAICLLLPALVLSLAANAILLTKSDSNISSLQTQSPTMNNEQKNQYTLPTMPPTATVIGSLNSTALPSIITEAPAPTAAVPTESIIVNQTTPTTTAPAAIPTYSSITTSPTTTTTNSSTDINTTSLITTPTYSPTDHSQHSPSNHPSQLRGSMGNTSGVFPKNPLNAFKTSIQLLAAVDAYLLDNSSLSSVAQTYGHPIGIWNVSQILDLNGLFDADRNALTAGFNEDIRSWDVSSCTSMKNTFRGAEIFNQNLSLWNTGKVTSMFRMFRGARSFRGEGLSTWDVSKVVDFSSTFRGASAFREDLLAWNVSSVRNAKSMFAHATAFRQNLCSWGGRLHNNVTIKLNGMFVESGCVETDDPDLSASPRGPFCHSCTV